MASLVIYTFAGSRLDSSVQQSYQALVCKKDTNIFQKGPLNEFFRLKMILGNTEILLLIEWFLEMAWW